METREQREWDWGHHSAILETKEKILSSHEVYLNPERRPFNKVSFCCMCAEEICKRNLNKSTLITPKLLVKYTMSSRVPRICFHERSYDITRAVL